MPRRETARHAHGFITAESRAARNASNRKTVSGAPEHGQVLNRRSPSCSAGLHEIVRTHGGIGSVEGIAELRRVRLRDMRRSGA